MLRYRILPVLTIWLTLSTLSTGGFLDGGARASAADASASDTSAPRPNILFILADDLGWNDVSYHGSPMDTPHIDRLAKEGVELDRHYVYPMCTPTRVAFLTGHYPSRYGNRSPSNQRVLPWNTTTLASALQSVGYRTHLAGKWHLGSAPDWSPNYFGFDETYGSLAGGCGYFRHLYKKGRFSVTWHRNGKLAEEEGHTTDLVQNQVIEWIEQGAKKDAPWFIYVPFTAVHLPIQPKEEWVDYYKDRFKDRSERIYPALTTHMDDAIGQMVNALDRTAQRDNTLVIFLSDNGAIPKGHVDRRYPGNQWAGVAGSNAPLRGQKGTLYEGGIRTPSLAFWPGKLAPRKLDTPLHITDWMPTLTRLAGYTPKTDQLWDGQDIWATLVGGSSSPPAAGSPAGGPPPRTMYWKFTKGRHALRHGDLKLVVAGDKREVYDVTQDPSEKNDLLTSLPPQEAALVLHDLSGRLKEVRKRDFSARPPDRHVPYKTRDGVGLRLHVYEPADHHPGAPGFVPRPAIVFFFGGGWTGGSATQFYAHCAHYADRGMVAIAADYRTRKAHGATPYDCVKDAKSALRWVRHFADKLGVDPNRIAAGGGSAGGHLAAATAMLKGFNEADEDTDVSARPDALVLFNPVLDNRPQGYGYERIKERLEEFSPILNIRADTPPTIIFLGTLDSAFPVASAKEYKERMDAAGARCDLKLYEGERHGFFNYREGRNPRYKETLAEADAFLESLSFLEPVVANFDGAAK